MAGCGIGDWDHVTANALQWTYHAQWGLPVFWACSVTMHFDHVTCVPHKAGNVQNVSVCECICTSIGGRFHKTKICIYTFTDLGSINWQTSFREN